MRLLVARRDPSSWNLGTRFDASARLDSRRPPRAALRGMLRRGRLEGSAVCPWPQRYDRCVRLFPSILRLEDRLAPHPRNLRPQFARAPNPWTQNWSDEAHIAVAFCRQLRPVSGAKESAGRMIAEAMPPD